MSRLIALTALMAILVVTACVAPPDRPIRATPPAPWQLSMVRSGGVAGEWVKLDLYGDGRLEIDDRRRGRKVRQLDAAQTARLRSLVPETDDTDAPKRSRTCRDCIVIEFSLKDGGHERRGRILSGQDSPWQPLAAELHVLAAETI